MSFHMRGNCKGQVILCLMLIVISVHFVSTESPGPPQCPTDVSDVTMVATIAVHQRRRRTGSTSLPPSPTSQTTSFQEMDDAKIRFSIRHPVVSPTEVVLEGLRYTVEIDVVDTSSLFDGLFLQSTQRGLPFGMFLSTNESISRMPTTMHFCRHPRSVVWLASYTNMYSLVFDWLPDSADRMNGCINITAAVRQDSQWYHKTLLLCNKEDNCHRHETSTYGTLQENDLQYSGTAKNCSEHIVILQFSENYQAFLQFQFVNLLFSKVPECTKEYIEVNTFEEERWNKIKFCGYLDYRMLARLHFASQAEAIIIRIKLVKGSTFKAVHYILDRRKGCNDTITLSRGMVTSPNFPGLYFPRLDCYVRISVRNGERAILRLRHMRLQTHPDGSCGSDYLEIEPSAPSGVATRRWFCGELWQYSQQYTTLFTSVDVTVHFHSDWLEESNGFVLDYAVGTSCGEELLRTANGSVFTIEPMDSIDVSESNRWEDCFTTIHVPYSYVIELRATSQQEVHSLSAYFHGSQFRPVGNSIQDDDDALNNETANCIDGFIEVVEWDATWVLCDLTLLISASYASRSNTLMVRLVRDRLQYLPKASITYTAIPVNESQVECAYGWVAGPEHCYLLVEQFMAWETAEEYCRNEGGHLASVFDSETQLLLNAIVNSSLFHDDEKVFWIGGNDRMFENYFEWADSRPMSYTNWFKGWSQHNFYNVQPSDDGLSNQDCVELRRKYAYPGKGYGTKEAFFWNDRDCSVVNPFICERLKTGVVPRPYPASCNRTLTLTMIHQEDVITSPAYPEPYPRNMDCSTTVIVPTGYKVVIIFTNFVLEDGPACQYDYLEISGNAKELQRHCGNWTNRLKLLRHESVTNRMIMKFVSDFSHSYAGFTAHVRMEKEDMFCADDWPLRFNDDCYLLVMYPTVTWQTAEQICSEKQAHLVSVVSEGEELYLEEEIMKQDRYNSGSAYWFGGQKTRGTAESWTWNDGLPFSYSAFSNNVRESGDTIIDWPEDNLLRGELCLALRWRAKGELDGKLPRNRFYWFGRRCGNSASYICKKKSLVASLISNVTIRGLGGNISSPNYPAMYSNNLNYVITLLGPSKTRIVINFLYLDTESQKDCLYDYVAVQSSKSGPVTRLCGPNAGKNQRPEYISDSNELRLTFNTDYADVGGGFFATWTTVDVSSCPSELVCAESGGLTSINFPNPYLTSLECVTQVQLPAYTTELQRWIWIEFNTFIVGHGNGGDLFRLKVCPDDYLELTFGGIKDHPSKYSTIKICGNLTGNMQHLGFLSNSTEIQLSFHSEAHGRFQGFQAKYQMLTSPEIQHVVHLIPNTSGIFHELNHPLAAPHKASYTRKLVLPMGYIVHLEVKGFVAQRTSKRSTDGFNTCSRWSMEIRDPYIGIRKGSGITTFCKARNESAASKFLIRSYLNVLYLHELMDGATENDGYFRMVHTVTRDPDFNHKTLAILGGQLESCDPNPCQNQRLCISENDVNLCQCGKQYTGMFCQMTVCDQMPCVNGTCNLSVEGYACSCYRNYMGTNCDVKINPCASNPCGNRGICAVENDNFVCKCQIWWQGPQCETKAFKFTYRPLSQRMLEEPFWLGLITVFVVLAVLGCVWCIKRKFADKLEKFISEEIERNKSQSACKASKRHSMGDQGSPLSLSPQSCPRSLLSRIGLRKHSMLSLDSSGSSNYHENRSFSFDDIIKKSDSQRRLDKRSSSPAMQLDKQELLHSLVSPAPAGSKGRRMSLDEFIQMSERRILERNSSLSQDNCDSINEETSFDSSASPTHQNVVARRKRVNFHRTLEKIDSVSFENEREDEINLDVMRAMSSANSSLFLRPDSSDFSDCDTSLCSSTHAFPEDDIVTNGMEDTTEDDVQKLRTITDISDCSSVELDSSWTSSEHINSIQAEVRVEVHDVPRVPVMFNPAEKNTAIEDHKSSCSESIERSPTIIAITSPKSPKVVKQMCTMDSCCTNVIAIHSLQRKCNIPHVLKNSAPNPGNICINPAAFKPTNQTSTECCVYKPDAQSLKPSPLRKVLVRQETIPFGQETFDNLAQKPYSGDSFPNSFIEKAQLQVLPKVEMTTYNVTEQSRMAKLRPPPLQIQHLCNKPLMENSEKASSLDFPIAPIITITSNISSCESDTDSPTKTTSRMQYLSPFDITHQNGERSTSLSNLSSSGYSSMASPGPSRCNSNSPLFDDISPGLRPSPTNICRKYGQHLSPTNLPIRPVSPKHGPKGITIPKTGHLGCATNPVGQEVQTRVRPPLLKAGSVMRKRSDSDTTDDQPEAASLPEDSNDDEGIGMDHIDFKIHRGEVTSAKDLELYMDKGKVDTEDEKGECSDCHRNSKEVVEPAQEVACPAIIIQAMLQNDSDRDRCWKFVRRKSFQRKLSPVSSRSESPMSDRGSAIFGANINSPSHGEKLSSLFFSGDKGSNQSVYKSDSDEVYDDRPNSEASHSPTSEVKSPTSTFMPGVFQARKQVRRRDKSHGNKSAKNSAGKLRPKTTSSSSSADGVPKDDRSYKRSPKRRLRLQNSLDADASSSDSMKDSPKDIVIGTTDNAQNKGAYRKRLNLSRCESLPVAIQLSSEEPTEGSTHLSRVHLVNGHAQIPHSLSAPAPETDGTDDCVDTMLNHASLSSLPYLNLSAELIQNNNAVMCPVEQQVSLNHVGRSTASNPPSVDENAEGKTSRSDVDVWEKDRSLQDVANSVLNDDSGSEVSFYLGNNSSQLTEKRSLLSPARVSPDMSVICYGALGFGRSCSEEDDLGLF